MLYRIFFGESERESVHPHCRQFVG